MGNGTSMLKRGSQNKPRVVLESPLNSQTDTTKQTRVKFSNVKSNNVSFKVKPRMTDIGQVPVDNYHSGRVKLQRSQSVGVGSNHVEMNSSQTSVNTNASAVSAPVDGYWEPILDPHDENHWSVTRRRRLDHLKAVNENPNFYTGFKETDMWGEYRTINGLSKIEEL